MFRYLFLIILILLSSACSTIDDSNTALLNNNQSASPVLSKQVNKPNIIHQPPLHTTTTNNYNNSQTLVKLKALEHYLGNSSHFINEAEVLQDKNCRYCFNFDNLRRDIFEIVSAVDRFIHQDKSSTAPREIPALRLRY